MPHDSEHLVRFDCPRTCPMFEAERNGAFDCRFNALFANIGPVRVTSHVAEIDLEVRDLDALERACHRLGLEFRWGQKSYRWWGTHVGDYPLPAGFTVDDLGKCSHAIAIPNNSQAYEVGVVQKADGSYGLLWDFIGGGYGLEAVVGSECKKLTDEYSIAVAESSAAAQGWLCERTSEGALTIYHPSGGTLTMLPGGTLDASGFVGEGCHSAMIELGMPLLNSTAKPESAQVVAQAQVIGA
jgi:hypothetical protein